MRRRTRAPPRAARAAFPVRGSSRVACPFLLPLQLERGLAALARTDPDDVVEGAHEDLPVAELAGLRRLQDRLDGLLDELVAECYLDLDLGQELDLVLAAAVGLGVALLATEPLHLGNRHPHDADFLERRLHCFQKVRAHDGFDLLHHASSCRESLPLFAPRAESNPCSTRARA